MSLSMRQAPVICFALLLTMVAVAACGPDAPAPDELETPSPAGDSEILLSEGEKLYVANCQVCHGGREGQGASGGAPPQNDTGHTWHHPDAQIKDWVLNGKFPGAMPAFKDRLSEDRVDAILAFIKTWWTPEQREGQANISRRYQEALDRQKEGQ